MKTHLPASLTRRGFLRAASASAAAAALLPVLSPLSRALAAEGKKSLVLYFSHSGNTRALAREIQKATGSDIAELLPATPYPTGYDDVVAFAKKQLEENARPPLAEPVPNPDPYATIFLGFPNWWSTMPMIFFTYLDAHPLAGKTVAPFCTHGGGGFGNSLEDLKTLCPNATITAGLSVRGSRASKAQEAVAEWLKEIGWQKS